MSTCYEVFHSVSRSWSWNDQGLPFCEGRPCFAFALMFLALSAPYALAAAVSLRRMALSAWAWGLGL